MRQRIALLAILFVHICWLLPQTQVIAARIEAVKGKNYRLTKQHGPWMIMVSSFRNNHYKDTKRPGMTAEEAANQLVYELRRKGIPAYTYTQKGEVAYVNTMDRAGQQDRRIYAAQRGMISVIAGNYPSLDHRVAQDTLEYIKRFQPKFLNDVKSGARMSRTRRKENRPFKTAFLTINPMLSPAEAREREIDPLLIKLNHGAEYSLLDNPAKYTLVVASFPVKSIVSNGDRNKSTAWLEKLQLNGDQDDAATNALQFAQALRRARQLGYDQNYDAFVYHDRHHSIVTVGQFNSSSDPLLLKYAEQFRAKVQTHPITGQDVLTGEVFTIPRKPPIQKTWLFDPKPKLIEVPRLSN